MTLELERTLHEHAFLAGMAEEQIASLAPLATVASFEENELILVDGRRSASFYLLIEGSVSIELRTPRYAVAVQALAAGDACGWSSVLDNQETLFQVRAREKTLAFRFAGAALKQLFREDPVLGVEIMGRLLRLVAGRVQATEARFAEMCGVRLPPDFWSPPQVP